MIIILLYLCLTISVYGLDIKISNEISVNLSHEIFNDYSIANRHELSEGNGVSTLVQSTSTADPRFLLEIHKAGSVLLDGFLNKPTTLIISDSQNENRRKIVLRGNGGRNYFLDIWTLRNNEKAALFTHNAEGADLKYMEFCSGIEKIAN